MTDFDLTGPLPSGVTVLEASAGTGKTYAIAALAARYVAEGTPLHQLLLVTFTRMATGELRDRVRRRLVEVEAGLRAAQHGVVPDREADAVLALLATGDDDTVEQRRANLERALSDFDAATIATTHRFCQDALAGLGVSGDTDRDAAFVEDVSDLVEEVADDLYVRAFRGERKAQERVSRKDALAIARIAIENPDARILPVLDPAVQDAAQQRAKIADAARTEFAARKRRRGILDFDDLLTRLDSVLAGPHGRAAAANLRERYRVVLIDEFQDTDPIQWRIVRAAFAVEGVERPSTLVLIGDPKQAIYAFRGADVFAYLDAAAEAGGQATLGVNRRSDAGLLRALDALFGNARLGHPRIAYRRAVAAPGHEAARLQDAPESAPLRVRVLPRDTPGLRLHYKKPTRESTVPVVAADLAADVVRLLSSGATIDGAAVEPGDIAVLVSRHAVAAACRDALDALGVPAVIGGAGNVFETWAAQEWLRLLEALERPASGPRARSAALTPFLGWTAEHVATAGDEEWEDVHRRLHAWARVARLRGIAALAEVISHGEGLPARVLAVADGERALTDLRHIGQLLHAEAVAGGLGVPALIAWLRRRIADAGKEGDRERSRRLESDADAVQLITIHSAKGLEFPIVYLPDLWDSTWGGRDSDPAFFHDPAAGDARTIDVGLGGEDWADHRKRHVAEKRGESLRMLYVALTRARHQAVVWWVGADWSNQSALTRLAFGRDGAGEVPDQIRAVPEDDAAIARLQAIGELAPACIAVETAGRGLAVEYAAPGAGEAVLAAATFDRSLDLRWRRTSYSAMTAAAHEAFGAPGSDGSPVASEPEEAGITDEPAAGEEANAALLAARQGEAAMTFEDALLREHESPLAGMAAGTAVGTFVHAVLETADFAAQDLDTELVTRVAEAQAWRALDLGDPEVVQTGLRAALETPLGPLAQELRLCDIARADRLDELGFELPLAGGDAPHGDLRVEPAAIGALLARHLPKGDPLHGYAARLEDPALRQGVRGYLTGSIDLVFRLPDGRYALADYKTNWLGSPGEPLTAWHHRPAALIAEMERAHYGLQALLYTVALHRYLRWRVPGHDPERDLAGVFYLFVRGMSGADTPRVDGNPCGVFAWRPPGALVVELSDLLGEGGA